MENLKTVLESFIQSNKATASILESLEEQYQDGNDVIDQYIVALKSTNYSPALSIGFADIVQNEESVTQEVLDMVSNLYDSLLQLEEFNLEIFIAAVNFELAIQGNAAKAKSIAETAIERAEQKLSELKRLMTM